MLLRTTVLKTAGLDHASYGRAWSRSSPEVLLELLIDEVLDAVVAAVLLRGVQLEAKATTTLLNDAAANITGHDEQGVLEVDCPALGVREPPVLKNLQHGVEDIWVGLLDLVKQHHGVRPSSHGLCELTALVVADVTGRRSDQLADRMPLHELGHIQAHHGLFAAEVVGGQGLGEL